MESNLITKNTQNGVYICIENKYSPINSVVFELSQLIHFLPLNNIGNTVLISINGMADLSPSIPFAKFLSFFRYVIEQSQKQNSHSHLFTIIIKEDLSCEWRYKEVNTV
ncbi:hypothetical protein V5030_02280 [Moellerella wisconsensis]